MADFVHVHERGHPANRKFQQWVLPVVTGGYGWLTICDCGAHWTGVADTLNDAERHGTAMVHVGGKVNPRRKLPLRTATGHLTELPPLLTRLVEHDPKRRLPGQEFVVATDASYHFATDRFGWAVVTGAGWVATNAQYEIPGVELTSQAAEFAAVMDAISLFPRDASITILTDNQKVAAYVQRAVDRSGNGRVGKPPAWVSLRHAGVLGDARWNGPTVDIRWIPRNSHPLHAAADRYSRVASDNSPGLRLADMDPLNDAARDAVEDVIREGYYDRQATRLAWRAARAAVAAMVGATDKFNPDNAPVTT